MNGGFDTVAPPALERLTLYVPELAEQLNAEVAALRKDTATNPNKQFAFDAAWQRVVSHQHSYDKLVTNENDQELLILPKDYEGPEQKYFQSIYIELMHKLRDIYTVRFALEMLERRAEMRLKRCALCRKHTERFVKCQCGTVLYCSVTHKKQHSALHMRTCPVAIDQNRSAIAKQLREGQPQAQSVNDIYAQQRAHAERPTRHGSDAQTKTPTGSSSNEDADAAEKEADVMAQALADVLNMKT